MANCEILVGEVFCVISGEYDLEALRKATSYPVEGCYFVKSYQDGHWDGRKHLFDKRLKAFPAGLLPYVMEAIKSSNPLLEVSVKWAGEPIPEPVGGDFNLHGIVFAEGRYDYQRYAVEAMIGARRGIVKIATNGGKTSIAIAVTKYLGLKTLFLVERKELVYQTRKEYALKLNVPLETIGIIGDGKCQIEKITVASPTSFLNRVEDGSAPTDWKVLFCDECQGTATDSYYSAAALVRAPFRWGLSVSGDSWILSKKSEKIRHTTIKELFKEHNADTEGEISVDGLEVRCFNNGKFCWKPVKTLIAHEDNRPLLKVDAGKGASIKITKDHSVFVVDRQPCARASKKQDFSLKCVEGEELKVGDYIFLESDERNKELSNESTLLDLSTLYRGELKYITSYDLKLSNCRYPYARHVDESAFAQILGVFIGDGWIDGNRLGFAIANHQILQFLDVIRSAGLAASVTKRGKGCAEVKINNKMWAEIFKLLKIGKTSNTKNIPNICWNFSRQAHEALMQGLLFSDGNLQERKGNKKRNSYTTTSTKLAYDVYELAKSVGKSPGISKEKTLKKGGTVRGKQILSKHLKYTIHWSAHEKSGYKGGKRWPSFIKREDIDKRPFEGLPVKINSITEEHFSGLVYDLEVEDAHNFLANGVLVHNSGTPLDRTDGGDLKLIAQTGPIVYEVSNKLLVERRISVPPRVKMIPITEPKIPKKTNYASAEKLGIRENAQLNDAVVQNAIEQVQEGNQVLILVDKTSHGNFIKKLLLQAKAPRAVFIHGKETMDTRLNTLEEFKRGDLRLLMATTIMDAGIDLPNIDVLILAAGGKSRIRILQRVGRGLRSGKDKDGLLVIDFANLTHKYLIKHSMERLQTYVDEECFLISK